jgi:hypothetical protein
MDAVAMASSSTHSAVPVLARTIVEDLRRGAPGIVAAVVDHLSSCAAGRTITAIVLSANIAGNGPVASLHARKAFPATRVAPIIKQRYRRLKQARVIEGP